MNIQFAWFPDEKHITFIIIETVDLKYAEYSVADPSPPPPPPPTPTLDQLLVCFLIQFF